MDTKKYSRVLFLALLLIGGFGASALAQSPLQDPLQIKVQGPTQRLEMIVNSSRVLTLEKELPKALVNNPDLLRAVPISPNQIQVSAIKPGVTQVNLWDSDGRVYTVDVVIYADGRELQLILQSEFPHAALRVRPLASSVVLSGHVDKPEEISQIIGIAEDYYPKVINNISVGGVHQVALHVKVMEVSRTKLRQLGIDWANFNGNDFVVQNVSELINSVTSSTHSVTTTGNETFTFGVVDDNNSFFGVLEALRQNNLVKVLSEPTLTTVSGRPASFNAGGEFPIIVPQSLGTVSIEFKQFGTRVDFVPIVRGNGNIRLEVRPQVSEIDETRGVIINGINVPGLRTRWVDTAAEMRAGQTLALAGLLQTRVEGEMRGLPVVSDLPWVGAAFRSIQEEVNEIELLVLVRPELVDGMDPHEVPPVGPGEQTSSPSDVELYGRGYLEVPNCCIDGSCPSCQSTGVPAYAEPTPAPVVVPSTTHSARFGGQLRTIRAPVVRPSSANRSPMVHAESRPTNPKLRRRHGSQPARVARRQSPVKSTHRFDPRDQNQRPRQPKLIGPSGYDNLDY